MTLSALQRTALQTSRTTACRLHIKKNQPMLSEPHPLLDISQCITIMHLLFGQTVLVHLSTSLLLLSSLSSLERAFAHQIDPDSRDSKILLFV